MRTVNPTHRVFRPRISQDEQSIFKHRQRPQLSTSEFHHFLRFSHYPLFWHVFQVLQPLLQPSSCGHLQLHVRRLMRSQALSPTDIFS